jgi:hypothetical protein
VEVRFAQQKRACSVRFISGFVMKSQKFPQNLLDFLVRFEPVRPCPPQEDLEHQEKKNKRNFLRCS